MNRDDAIYITEHYRASERQNGFNPTLVDMVRQAEWIVFHTPHTTSPDTRGKFRMIGRAAEYLLRNMPDA